MAESQMAAAPRLSVVVALISGRADHLQTCLQSLTRQLDPPPMEILVPFDQRLSEVPQLQTQFPSVQFIAAPLGEASPWSREHHDELRAIGLRHARSEIVALTEDHCRVGDRWCAVIVNEHAHPPAIIGGAVENGSDRWLNWAIYFTDFGRYQNPVPHGPVAYLSDCNISYKRKALEEIADLWENAYHEETVNWALRQRGEILWACPAMVVWQQREKLRLASALRERYVWGRSYAGTRVAEAEPQKRLFYAAFSFLLPPLLLARMLANILRKRRQLGKFALAFPLSILLVLAWSWGEFVGYTTGQATAVQKPAPSDKPR